MAEEKVRSITRIYYSNPKIQETIFDFSKDRETIPRYFEGFGKRPDTLQYPSDIMSLVNKGATSFHTSEELWSDPLQIDSDFSVRELTDLRKSWDLLIDIDSPFLDYSKIAAILIIDELESQGIKNYGIKFSGSKGFHIVVPSKSFPTLFEGQKTKDMFPEWPRAISEYLMFKIRRKYNKEVTKLDINFKALEERTKLKKADVTEIACPNCEGQAKKTNQVRLKCDRCNNLLVKLNYKVTNRKLKCIDDSCPGSYEVLEEGELFMCENCNYSSLDKTDFNSRDRVVHTSHLKKSKFSSGFEEQFIGEKIASLDLVLVASRHLFRAPYSLHEKTALASIVINKDQIKNFDPKDADPMKVLNVKEFYPIPQTPEATNLLKEAIEWKSKQVGFEEEELKKKYASYDKIDVKGVSEDLFPKPIKKLLKGLENGRKRGLFILLTFLRTLNFTPEYINNKVKEWNKLNEPPLKEGYVKSQIDWHLRQKKQILPPNYKNENFYKDLNLIDALPKEKNPISEVLRSVRRDSF